MSAQDPADQNWSTEFFPASIGTVNGISAGGSDLFVAGNFRTDGPDVQPLVLKWSEEEGMTTIGRPRKLPDGDTRGWVGPVLATEDTLFVGGDLDLGGGQARVYAWDRSTSAWSPFGEGLDHRIVEIADGEDGRLYALTRYILDRTAPWYAQVFRREGDTWKPLGSSLTGHATSISAGPSGVFVSIETETASDDEVRRWTGSGWTGIGVAGSPEYVIGEIHTLAQSSNGALYAGGNFESIGDTLAEDIARWTKAGWSPIGEGLDGPAANMVHDIAVRSDTVFAAGRITQSGVRSLSHIVRWAGERWETLSGGTNGDAFLVAAAPDHVATGGSFTVGGTIASPNLAVWHRGDGRWKAPYEPSGHGVSGAITALAATSNGRVLAGGSFRTAGSVRARRVALWDGAAWSTLGDGLPSEVTALETSPEAFYASGSFRPPEEEGSFGLARWEREGSAWSFVDTGTEGRMLTEGKALVQKDGHLYVAGTLRMESGENTAGLFLWHGGSWTVIGEVSENGDSDPSVSALSTGENGTLILGGDFGAVGEVEARNVAAWDGSSWSPIGTGISEAVGTLASGGGQIVAGGEDPFGNAGEGDSLHVFRPAEGRWSRIQTGLVPPSNCSSVVRALIYYDGHLLVGGGIGACATRSSGDGPEETYLVRWDGDRWHEVGSGIDGTVTAFSIPGSELYAGGSFERAGSHPSQNIARWNDVSVLRNPGVAEAPGAVRLLSNRPNPFNPTTVIPLHLPRAQDVTLTVYDRLGRKLRTVVDTRLPEGAHRIPFKGSELPSGVYFYRLEAGSITRTRTMVLAK